MASQNYYRQYDKKNDNRSERNFYVEKSYQGQRTSNVEDDINTRHNRNYTMSSFQKYGPNDQNRSQSNTDYNQRQRGFSSYDEMKPFSQRPVSDTPRHRQHNEMYPNEDNRYNYRNQTFNDEPNSERFEEQTSGNKRYRESENSYTQNKHFKHRSSANNERQIYDEQSSHRFQARRETALPFSHERNYKEVNEVSARSFTQNRESRFSVVPERGKQFQCEPETNRFNEHPSSSFSRNDLTWRDKQFEDRSIENMRDRYSFPEHKGSFSSPADGQFLKQNISTEFDRQYGSHSIQIKEEGVDAGRYSSDRENPYNEQYTGQRDGPLMEDNNHFSQFGRDSFVNNSFGWQGSKKFSTGLDGIPPGEDVQFRQFENNIDEGKNTNKNIFENRNLNIKEELSDSFDQMETNIDDSKESDADHDDAVNSEDEGCSNYINSSFVLDQALIEKYKYYPPSALELSKIFQGIVVMYFYKPKASEEKNPFVVLCESFRRSNFGDVSVEDGCLKESTFIKFCTLRIYGMMLVRAVGQHGNIKEPRVRAGIELINKLAQYCYTLKMKGSYFDGKNFHKMLQNKTSEYYRFVPTSKVNNVEAAYKYIDNYVKEDTDQELVFELNNPAVLKSYLRTKGCTYRIPNPKSSHIIVSKWRSPQYLRDKMLAKGQMENEMYELIPPQGEGVDLIHFSSIASFVPALNSKKAKKNFPFSLGGVLPLLIPPGQLYGPQGIETSILKATVPWERKRVMNGKGFKHRNFKKKKGKGCAKKSKRK